MIRGFYTMLLLSAVVLPEGLAQFIGGIEDGYDFQIIMSSTTIYAGGAADGSGFNQSTLASSIFIGGDDHGYGFSQSPQTNSIFLSDEKDGYASAKQINSFSIFSGDLLDGYSTDIYTNSTSIYGGGINDGYNTKSSILRWVWTGATNSNWNINTNWSIGSIPTNNSKVVIPAHAPNYPLLIGGLLNIGPNQITGDYFCKNLTIRVGAQFNTNTDALLINNDKVQVEGILTISNPTLGSFTNVAGATLNIKSTGQVIFN